MNLYEQYQASLAQTIDLRRQWLSSALIEEGIERHSRYTDFVISDEDYNDKILPYWSRYGVKPPKFWFEMHGARDRVIDPHFIPDDIYFCDIIPYINNLQFADGIKDKGMIDITLPGVKHADTVCRRLSGEFYNSAMELISAEDAVSLCMDYPDPLFLKKCFYTAGGRGVTSIQKEGRSEDQIRQAFDDMGSNFIVQGVIKQHPSLAALCPSAVNTLRIVTLFIEGKVTITNMDVRIGLDGHKWISLNSSGGYVATIYEDGSLDTRIQTEKGEWLSSEDIGLFGPGYKIPGFSNACDTARRLHLRYPHFKLIGWDFTVDVSGDPVFIEMNFAPGIMPQMTNCFPVFGEYTDYILDDYYINRKMADNQVQGLLVQM